MATSRPRSFPRVPYASIRWLVGNVHVATPKAMLARNIERRMKLARARPPRKTFKATEAEIREAVRYALAVHEDNRETYRRVMGGRL